MARTQHKPRAKRRKEDAELADFPLEEMVAADVLTDGELATVKRFVASIRSRHEDEVLEMAAEDLEEAMAEIGRPCGVVWKQVRKRSTLHTALLYAMFRHLDVHVPHLFEDLHAFAQEFPEFDQHDEEERWSLLRFGNAVHLMAHFIPPALNKQVYMEVSSRLSSDFRRRFVTGGGQTAQTADRVHIYERIGNVTKHKRSRKLLRNEEVRQADYGKKRILRLPTKLVDDKRLKQQKQQQQQQQQQKEKENQTRQTKQTKQTKQKPKSKRLEARDKSVEDSVVPETCEDQHQLPEAVYAELDSDEQFAGAPRAKKLRSRNLYCADSGAPELALSAASNSPTTTNEFGEEASNLPADTLSLAADDEYDIEFVIKQPCAAAWAHSGHIDIDFDILQEGMVFDPTLTDPFLDFDF